jgi:hypothetical protein
VISALVFFDLTQLSWLLSNPFSYYSPFHRIIEFSIGAIAASIQLKPSFVHLKHRVYIKIFMVLVLVAVLFYPQNFSVSENVIELVICTSIAIIILVPSFSMKWDKILNPLVWCGDRSYSLYLYHLPLLYLVQFGLFSRTGLPSSFLTFTAFLVIAFTANASYRFVEQPNRVRGSRVRIGGTMDGYFTRSLVIYFLLPLILLVSMNLAGNYKYFGLNRNLDSPPSAGELDPNCNRESFSGGPCVYSSLNKLGSVLLIGDSHAAMLSQMIVDEARKAHWESIIWTHNGYPPELQDAEDFTLNSFSDISVTNTIAQVKWIESNKPDIVIISAFLTTGDQAMLKNAITYIRKIAKTVIVINQTPLFTDTRFFRPYSILEKPYTPKKSILLSEMNQSAFLAGEKFSVWAEFNNIDTIDTVDLFCDKERCRRFNNKGWLYSDIGHLSTYGAQLVGPRVRVLFQESNK